VDASDDDGMLV